MSDKQAGGVMKLNLGSGELRKEGHLSVDLYAKDVDQRVDLSKFPWPWADNSVDAVWMQSYLEHVEDLDATIWEVHRILKHGGTLTVRSPHAHGPVAHCYDHKQYFTHATLCSLGYRWDAPQPFETNYVRLLFVVGERVKHWRWIWGPVEWLANRSVWAWEFLRLPVCSIEWQGVKR